MEDRYIGTSEAAQIIGVTNRSIINLCLSGKIPGAVLNGKRWRMPLSSVQALAEDRNAEKGNISGEKRLALAVGNTSYTDIANTCYYVDKTLLIKELIDSHNMVTLFTRPRRFGKTLALSMLKAFFEISDTDNSVFFRNKKIWDCGEEYTALQGKFPVIYLSFKDVKLNTWADALEAIRLVVKDEYRRHPELAQSEKIDDAGKEYIRRIMNNSLSEVEFSRSLLNLCEMLCREHGQQVIILIDEYDIPIQQGFIKSYYDEVISFMRNFLSGGLKDNDSLAFGVLTGILRVSKENLFSGLNNITVNTVLDEKYSKFFGFTEEEVTEIAGYYGASEKLPEIKEWYDGYMFGGTGIYNPWSVSSYFSNGCVPRNFWTNTADNEIIGNILRNITPDAAAELISLMQGNIIHTSINTEVIYPRIADGSDSVFSFLVLAGYLTLNALPEETDIGTYAQLRLPNLEIHRVYNTEILSWLKDLTGPNVVGKIEKTLYLGDAEGFKDALQAYMLSCVSCFDASAESFYHGMVLGLVASLSSRYHISSNRESGYGRFDLQLEPKVKNLPGIIMEFKALGKGSSDNLKALSEEALMQIAEKSYEIGMKQRGIDRIVCYGIAFMGKNVEVSITDGFQQA